MFLIVILLLVNLGCTSTQIVEQEVAAERIPYQIISGTIFYPNNLYFPSRVRLEISLVAEHVSGVNSHVMVEQIITNPQRFPVNFILRYDPREISRMYEYSIVVELYREDETLPYLQNLPFSLPTLTGDDNIIVELRRNPQIAMIL
jgi:uncharacterized lipoprotein YbaY